MLTRIFSTVPMSLLAIFSSFYANASSLQDKSSSEPVSDPVVISVPASNTNGMFVVKVSSALGIENLKDSVFELYRNYEGGRFELVESLPRYSAISQVLSRQGRYGYKAVIHVDGPVGEKVYETAGVSYVDVAIRNYGLMQKSKPVKKSVSKFLSKAD